MVLWCEIGLNRTLAKCCVSAVGNLFKGFVFRIETLDFRGRRFNNSSESKKQRVGQELRSLVTDAFFCLPGNCFNGSPTHPLCSMTKDWTYVLLLQ